MYNNPFQVLFAVAVITISVGLLLSNRWISGAGFFVGLAAVVFFAAQLMKLRGKRSVTIEYPSESDAKDGNRDGSS